MSAVNRLAPLACLLVLVTACTSSPRDRDDDSTPTRKDGGVTDGGSSDAGSDDGGSTDGGLVCPQFFADCNEDANDGCEADLRTDQSHCGQCHHFCEGTCSNTLCATGGTPAIEVCTYDGNTLLSCATPPISLSLDFGLPASGTLATRRLEIRSTGTAALQVEGPAFSGNADFAATPNPFSANLAPQEKASLNLTFGPLATGPRSATLTLATNALGAANINIGLTGGTAVTNCQLQASSSITFGSVAVLSSSTQTWSVQNTGNEDCVISAMPGFINGIGGNFEVSPVSLPITVAPGEAIPFSLSYTPQDSSGPDSATLRLKYAAVVGPEKRLDVSLTGSPVAVQECLLEALPAVDGSGTRKLEFGNVAVNTTNTLALSFTNRGGTSCTVSNPRLSSLFGSTAGFGLPSTSTLQVAPGATVTYNVTFSPTVTGEYGDTTGLPLYGVSLFVDTTDTKRFSGAGCSVGGLGTGTPGCVGWSVHGTGVNLSATASPVLLNFGTVKTSCQSPESKISVLASGGNVSVTSISLTPALNPAVFAVTSPATPFNIAANTVKDLPVRFSPKAAQTYNANLIVETSAGTITIPLTGNGTSSSTWTETFLARAKTDVLMVVDDSGSMTEEQTALAGAASPFINTAASLSADYQIAVVTTDMDASTRSGRFQGSPKVITASGSAATQLSTTIKALGINGSGTEMGLDAIKAALSLPLSTDPSTNGGFLRSDADLAIVVVSDEDDFSTGSADSYTTFLSNLKGSRKAVLHAIVGDTSPSTNSQGVPGCTSSSGDALTGSRYLTVQSQTGGLFRSICSASWTQPVTDIAQSIFAVPRSFVLSRPATAGSFTVKVNSNTVSSSTYTFDSSTNKLTFNVASAPAANSTIVVDYTPVCSP
jgi:hypothetical protein